MLASPCSFTRLHTCMLVYLYTSVPDLGPIPMILRCGISTLFARSQEHVAILKQIINHPQIPNSFSRRYSLRLPIIVRFWRYICIY